MASTAKNIREKPIKRLLRRKNTREYFNGDGWTKNPHEAKTFSDIVEVAEVCAHHHLAGVELAFRIHAEAADVFCTPIC